MAERIPKVFIFAGEASGDLHGSHLAAAMQKKSPITTLEGVAGPKMRLQGISGPLCMEDFEVMGLTDVLRSLPRLFMQFYKVRDYILYTRPHGVVLIDYPGFNLRLSKSLRKKGYEGKIIQYVSPSVWAHGAERIGTMEESADLLLTIYPFEKELFDASKLAVKYVGNPLCEYLKAYRYDDTWCQKLGIPLSGKLIALFPGSRGSEVSRNLPTMLEAAAMYKAAHPEAVFAISCAHEALVRKLASGSSLKESLFFVPREYTYELMRDSDTAIAKSGTVTLELALHHRPTVVIYQLTALNRLYAKYVLKLKLPHYCIVNILAQRRVFPELIESGFCAKNLFQELQQLEAPGPRRECIEACQAISQALQGQQDTSTLAATAIAEILSC